jgi:hypothetical protein
LGGPHVRLTQTTYNGGLESNNKKPRSSHVHFAAFSFCYCCPTSTPKMDNRISLCLFTFLSVSFNTFFAIVQTGQHCTLISRIYMPCLPRRPLLLQLPYDQNNLTDKFNRLEDGMISTSV